MGQNLKKLQLLLHVQWLILKQLNLINKYKSLTDHISRGLSKNSEVQEVLLLFIEKANSTICFSKR